MDWQRYRLQRRHFLSYLICGAILVAFVAATLWVYGKDIPSQQWWQEIRRALSLTQMKKRLEAVRLLQEAEREVNRENWAKAEALLRQAVETDPTSAEAWQLLLSLLVRQNRWDEAEALTEKIADRRAKIEALLLLADVAYMRRDWQKAEQLYQQVLKLDSNNATALNNYGYMLAELGERLDEAERMIRQALKHRPNEPAFLDSLGWVYYQRGNYKEAQKWIEKAVRSDPNDAELRYHLGMVYWRLGDKEKARKELMEALRLDPNHLKSREALWQLEQEEKEQEEGTIQA